MTTLLQISDAHFGTERAPVVAALSELARRLAPDLIVLSGDITQRARRRQFAAARRFVDSLAPAAVLAIPGNHDIPLFNLFARIGNPYGNYRASFGNDLEPMFESADVLVIGANTTRPERHKDGELSGEQIERVARRLHTAASGQLRIVVVHQPVLAIRASDEQNLLHGHLDAVPAWATAGVDIIMGGHIHLPYVRSMRSQFDGLSRDVWAVQAGTSVSSRIREGMPNSVNVVRTVAATSTCRECVVERWDYNDAASQFEVQDSQGLRFW